MKIKVSYFIRKILVSEDIEIGTVIDGRLDKEQNKVVQRIVDKLDVELNKKIRKMKTEIGIKTIYGKK